MWHRSWMCYLFFRRKSQLAHPFLLQPTDSELRSHSEQVSVHLYHNDPRALVLQQGCSPGRLLVEDSVLTLIPSGVMSLLATIWSI